MNIEFGTARTVNISKEWDGSMDDGTTFTIRGGWNDWDGYYVDDIEIRGFEGDEKELAKEIQEKFLNEMN
jgi:hypothetical protein